jgi:hypothetical protein
MRNTEEMDDGTVRTIMFITSEFLTNTWWEAECQAEVCHATNGAYIKVCSVNVKLSEMQCLKMYQFFLYFWWAELHCVLFYWHLRQTLCITTRLVNSHCILVAVIYFCFFFVSKCVGTSHMILMLYLWQSLIKQRMVAFSIGITMSSVKK